MQLNPYLLFDGNCAEAFKFYEQTLGGKIENLIIKGSSGVGTTGAVALDVVLRILFLCRWWRFQQRLYSSVFCVVDVTLDSHFLEL